METEKFTNRYLLKGGQITTSSNDDKVLEGYKAITEYFTFPCDFKNGVCGSRTDPRCCCQWCNQEIGYLKSINLKSLRKYAEAFSAKTGFWRQKVGCILPRNLRSTTCVSFICTSTYDKFKYSNYIEVVIFIHLLENYHNLLYGEQLELQKMYKILNVEYNNKIKRGSGQTMSLLAEGNMKSNIKKQRCNTESKVPIPVEYQRVKGVKKEIKHNKGLHTQISLCNIMTVSLLFGGIGILIASTFNFLWIVYIVSIAISLGAIHILPKFKSINIVHANNMKGDIFILWFMIFFGPIMTMFTLTMLLLPPKKKEKVKGSDETK